MKPGFTAQIVEPMGIKGSKCKPQMAISATKSIPAFAYGFPFDLGLANKF